MLIDRGRPDPDAPVAHYWPEFAPAGKQEVRVAELASHQARMPGIHPPLAPDDVVDAQRMAALLAAQPQDSDSR